MLPPARGVISAVLSGVTGSGTCTLKWSDDMDERGEATLRSEMREVCENCLLSRSRTLKEESAPGDAAACCAYAAALAADLKLLVDGGWRRPACEGGILEPG